MSLNRQQQKILAIVTCYASDLTLAAWLYFKATNFNLYSVTASQSIDSPDFQIQLYKILLQTLTFFLLVFLLAQTAVYVLAWKNFRAALLYLKLFVILAFAIFLFIAFTQSLFGILPLLIYLFGYYTFARLFKETSAQLQKLPQ